VPSQDQGALPLNTDVVDWPAYYGGATEDESRPIRLEPGRVFDAGALVAPRGPAARVRGLVVNAATGKPEPDARILLGRQRRRGVESSGMSTSFKNGFFELAGAAPGDYVIDAVTPTLAGSAMFQARGSDVESVRVLLHPRVRVSGRVRLDSTTQGMFGAGFGRMRVVLDAGRALIDASIDSRGAFTLANAPVGDYRLALSGAPPNVFIRTARLGGADIMEKGLHVDGKSNPSVEITLGAASSVLGVIALDAARKPAPGAVVALIPENRRQLDRYRKAVTDKSGDARLENVAPGTYRLYAWESIEENAWIDPDILDAYEKNGETVTIPETGLSIVTVTVNPL
jgi:hypothetical protein